VLRDKTTQGDIPPLWLGWMKKQHFLIAIIVQWVIASNPISKFPSAATRDYLDHGGINDPASWWEKDGCVGSVGVGWCAIPRALGPDANRKLPCARHAPRTFGASPSSNTSQPPVMR
jgi:hypothetical protein